MKWMEAKVVYEGDQPRPAIELIADLFDGFGLQGVWIEDPSEEPAEGWGEDALPRPTHHAVIGYFVLNESFEGRRLELEASLKRLADREGISTRVHYRQVDEEDWAESWKEFFWPEKITDRIVVKPTWRDYLPEPDAVVLEIDPGMAFGTGTHPTTAMCIRLIERHLRPGDDFLDVGTGSGILMIAAAKLGARSGLGIDHDETAVGIAAGNLSLNHIDPLRFSVAAGDLIQEVPRRFHLAAANILSEVVLTLLDSIGSALSDGGILICSGIAEERGGTVIAKMESVGFRVLEQLRDDGWTAIAGRLIGQPRQ
ncbi:MAG: 50S ribosomal protein L11 methyltransferase [Thermodesulfobacteriota bacterium]